MPRCFRSILALASLATMALGCVVHHHHEAGHEMPEASRRTAHGPPPHAPAHGHRRKHAHHGGSEVTIVFDSGLGVYVVLDHPGHYWDGKRYLRWTGVHWEASVDFDGGWIAVGQSSDVPPRLLAKHPGGRKPKHKHHPAKRAY